MRSYHIILCGLLYILPGCSPEFIYYETLPPRINLQPNQTDMLFISQFDTASFDYNQKKKNATFREGFARLVRGLEDGFDNFVVDIEWKDSIDQALPIAGRSIPPDIVSQLCADYQKDLLLSIENFDMERDKSVEVEENQDGSKTRTAYFTVVARTDLRVYAADGSVIDFLKMRKERPIESRQVLSGLFAIGPALGNQQEIIYPMLRRAGLDYAENFKPKKIIRREKCYTNGELKPVKPMIQVEDWEKARRFLIDIYSNTNDKQTRFNAAHNLYYLSLVTGDTEGANEWKPRMKGR